ncbi:MAG: hypothetical protein ACD_40C00157G0003 [uncultured bacterium]|nr:MAG: hypothetical protein ACD_40C00157G0003 [uncultured bacterium]
MKKIETTWHYLLNQAIEQKQFQHTQAGLARLFHYSTSTINLALTKPATIGAIRKSGKFFVVSDVQKLLYLWATIRNLSKDILYQTSSSLNIHELEGLAPSTALYGGYSAAVQLLGEPPSDYSSLYLYSDEEYLEEIQLRYPLSKLGSTKIVILKKPSYLPFPTHTSLPHTFVDIWNMSDWFAQDFIRGLEDKIHGLLS